LYGLQTCPAVVREFLARATGYLSQTKMLDLRCNGDLFTVTEITLNGNRGEKRDDISANITRALEVARGLQW
jgi:hypothetical protein